MRKPASQTPRVRRNRAGAVDEPGNWEGCNFGTAPSVLEKCADDARFGSPEGVRIGASPGSRDR